MMIRKITHLLALALLASLTACSTSATPTIEIENLSFSLDSRMLFFNFCKNSRCDLITYSLDNKGFTRIGPAEDMYYFGSIGFGRSKSQVVSMLRYRKAEFTSYPQVVLIDLNTKTYRKLTNDPSHKYAPNFSFDGSRVAYVQSHGQRTWANGEPRANKWDIHVLEIASGTESRVTNFCFYSVSKTFFVPDNADLVFSGDGPMCNYPTLGQPPGSKGYEQYERRFGEDTIIRMGPQRKNLEPWFQTTGKHSSNPHVASNGDVLFISRTNNMDGIKKGYYNYDLFLKRGDTIQRLTKLNTAMDGIALSPNSRYAVYLSDPERNRNRTLWLMNIEMKEQEQISLQALMTEIEKIPVALVSEER